MQAKRNLRNVWKREEAVSPVIATILMVAITVVLAGVLVLYMGTLTNQGGAQVSVTTQLDTIANPSVSETDTKNRGAWVVTVAAAGGPSPLSKATIVLSDGGIQIGSFKPTQATVSAKTGALAADPLNIYALAGVGTPQFDSVPGTTGTAVSTLNAAVSLKGNQIGTTQNAKMIYIDADSDLSVSPGDSIYVFKSNDGDTVADVNPGAKLSINIGGNPAGQKELT